jgi:hypothetical protein
MILPNVLIRSKIGMSTASGMDTIKTCLDKKHFKNYPYTVDYSYNDRGFRDTAWPDDINLSSSIWCIGDSFTVGIGSPFSHTWVQQLMVATQTRTINVSMDGASNTWISRKCCEIYDSIKPQNIVIMWSYLHRRELDDESLDDFDRKIHSTKATVTEDIDDIINCIDRVVKYCTETNIVQTIIPNWEVEYKNVILDQSGWLEIRDDSWPMDVPNNKAELLALGDSILDELATLHKIDIDGLMKKFKIEGLMDSLIQTVQIDFARDGHHFDILTAKNVVNNVLPHIKTNR